MALRRKRMVVLPLLLSLACVAEAGAPATAADSPVTEAALTPSEYAAELDRLASAIRKLSRADEVPNLLNSIPPVRRVRTSETTFATSTQWLRARLVDWRLKPDKELQKRMVANLQTLRAEALSLEAFPSHGSSQRALLGRILASKEFKNVQGQTWLDRLKQRIFDFLIRLLGKVFSASAISSIGDVLVYGLITLAVLVLLYWMYRTIHDGVELGELDLPAPPISSKPWTVWMAEARAAADQENWRDAIHLGYWCGISFLEGQGLWRPDVARTPREYLRLLSSTDTNRDTLRLLTRSFEVIWYGTEKADASAFSETLTQLEKMGCRSN
jgi:hypothetical protein